MARRRRPDNPTARSLRAAAAAILAQRPAPDVSMAPEALLRELQIHQIELEIQNQALRQSQAAIEESRDQYFDLYEYAPTGYVTLSRTGMVSSMNLRAAQLLAIDRTKLPTRRFANLVAEPDRDRWHAHFIAVRRGTVGRSIRLTLRRADGSDFRAGLDCIPDPAAPATRAVRIALSDVTIQEEQEEERRIAAIAFESRDPTFLTDGDGVILKVNRAFTAVTGFGREDAVGATPRLLNSGRHDPAFFAQLYRVLAETGYWHGEIWNKRKNGEVHPVWMTISAVNRPDGALTHYVVSFTDISELQALNRQLEEGKRLAEEANVAKSNFLSMMSHEIRTPMNGILGVNELLLRTALSAKQREFVDAITLSGDSLMKIIDGVLDLAKLEAGRIELENVSFGLRELVDHALLAFSVKAAENGLVLRAPVSVAATARFLGDPLRLRQVLLNLLSNAIKFTEEGAITVVVTETPHTETASRLRFEVHDTGIGVSAENKAKLFKPFQQAEVSIARRFGGTGLGLSICKHLIDLMGGQIGLQDGDGRGSTAWFEVVLPKSNGATAVTRNAEPLPPPPAPALILVAEDNKINALVSRTFLEARGYAVEVVADGVEAVSAVRDRRYDLILMDMQMPKLDGPGAARAIRGLAGDAAQVPIVAVTANAMKSDERLCLDAGMDDYLSKPINAQRLYETIDRWLKRATPERPG